MLAGGAGALLLLGGCGSGSGGGGSAVYGGSAAKATSGPSSAPSRSGAAGPVTTVTATETEFKISLSQAAFKAAFKAGAYTFKVVNHGNYPHNLTIAGPGITSLASPTSQGGGSGVLNVTLQAGSYELWCGVDSHRTKGMDIKITVA